MRTRTHPRIVILNEVIYRVTEKRFEILQKMFELDSNKFDKFHLKQCDMIREHGKKLDTADLILRDD